MKYPKGSMGAAEQKSNRIAGVVFAVITLLVLGVLFVFPSFIRNEVKDAPTWMNWVGGLLTAGSIVPQIISMTAKGEAKGFSWAWLILLALGFFFACGFFDNPRSYLND